MNPIKIKLITKGTHTQIQAEEMVMGGLRQIVVQMEKKETRERDLKERRVGTVAARLHCSFVPPSRLCNGLPVLKRRCRRGYCNKCHL